MLKQLISMVSIVGKFDEACRYHDWSNKIICAVRSVGLSGILTGEKSVLKPDGKKPTRVEVAAVEAIADEGERESQLKDIAKLKKAWKKYKEAKKLQMIVFTCLISSIGEKCEAYAEVRNNKDQDPAKLWAALKSRFQPSSESYYVKLLVDMLLQTISSETGGIQGLVDRITALRAQIVSAGGTVDDQNMKLALMAAIKKDSQYTNNIYQDLCKVFGEPFQVLAKTATDYENNLTNLGKVDREEEGSGERTHALVASKYSNKRQKLSCHHCGSDKHSIRDCPTAGPQCSICGRRGHSSKDCRGKSKKSKSRHHREESSDDDDEFHEILARKLRENKNSKSF